MAGVHEVGDGQLFRRIIVGRYAARCRAGEDLEGYPAHGEHFTAAAGAAAFEYGDRMAGVPLRLLVSIVFVIFVFAGAAGGKGVDVFRRFGWRRFGRTAGGFPGGRFGMGCGLGGATALLCGYRTALQKPVFSDATTGFTPRFRRTPADGAVAGTFSRHGMGDRLEMQRHGRKRRQDDDNIYRPQHQSAEMTKTIPTPMRGFAHHLLILL